MKRVNSKRRYMLGVDPISLGMTSVSTAMPLITGAIASKQQRKAEERARKLAMQQEYQADDMELDMYNTQGNNVRLYRQGGQLPTTGNQQLVGGQAVPISSDAVEMQGNKHSENTVDGEYGITIKDQNQQPVAEVEDEEIIKEDKVFSDTLMYKGKPFSKLAKQIEKQKGDKEAQLEKATDTKQRNTLERQISILDASSDRLFEKQGEVKNQIADSNLNSMAEDGTPKYELGNNPGYRNRRKNLNKDLYLTDEKNAFEDTLTSNERLATTAKTIRSFDPKGIKTNTVMPKAPLMEQPNSNAKINNSEVFDDSLETNKMKMAAGVSLIDNVAGAVNAMTAPRLPKPIYNKAARMKTTMNVNPQLAEVGNAVSSTVQDIQNNTSNSNVARGNMLATRLKGVSAKNNILAQKENIETELQNADAQNRAITDNANRQMDANYNERSLKRKNDIRSSVSGNIKDAIGDVKDYINATTERAQSSEDLATFIMANDTTDEMLRSMQYHPRYQSDPRLRELIKKELERREKSRNSNP